VNSREPENVIRSIKLTDGEVKFYQDYGYLYLPELVVSSRTSALREEVLDVLDSKGIRRQDLSRATEAADKLRQYKDYLKGSLIDKLINSEHTLDIASSLIGGQAIRYLPFTAVKSGAGGGQFHFHQDNNYTQHEPALGSINIWVALVDMTPENGCLQIAPESHKMGPVESINAGDGDDHLKVKVNPKHFLPIRMRAGDAIAFTRLTIHGSGPNQTNEPRVAYALQYHREDVRFHNRKTDKWERLIDVPRFQTQPLKRFQDQPEAEADVD